MNGGILHPYADTRVLPYYLRYVLGGEYQIRGTDIRTVGPLDSQQRVVGGDKFVLFNAEYYFDIFGPVRGLLFHDAGQAYAENQPIDLRQLRTSTGAELRVVEAFSEPQHRCHAAIDPVEDRHPFGLGATAEDRGDFAAGARAVFADLSDTGSFRQAVSGLACG